MDTDKVIKAMESKGYTVSDESGVLMFTGRFDCLDESMADIRKALDELGFRGSWGTKGYPKGKVPKVPNIKTEAATGESMQKTADVEAADEAIDENDAADEASAGGDAIDEALAGGDAASDYTQMTFDF